MAVYVPASQAIGFAKDLQYVNEGDVIGTPANFGAAPANPTFAFLGKNQRFTYKDNPEHYAVQTISDEGRSSSVLIRKSGTLNVDFDLTDFTYDGILDWFFSLNQTDFNSKMFFYSRNDGGTERYRLLNGCVPMRATISFPETNEPVHISCEILVTNPTPEGTTGPTLGSGAVASAISDAPVLPSDGSTDSFNYNSTAYKTKGVEITVEMQYSMIDADDSLVVQLMTPARRVISGTANVFRKVGADAIHADIMADPPPLRTISRVIKPFDSPTNGSRIDLADSGISEDEDNHSDIKSESTIKSYSFASRLFTLTELTS